MVEQLIAVLLERGRPTVLVRHRAFLVVWRLGALVGHLEEQQIGQLFDIVAIGHAVVAQDVAVVPGGGHWLSLVSCFLLMIYIFRQSLI